MGVAAGAAVDESEVACQDPYSQLTPRRPARLRARADDARGVRPRRGRTELDVRLGSGRTVSFATRPAPFGYAGPDGDRASCRAPRRSAARRPLDASGRALSARRAARPTAGHALREDRYRYEDWFFFGEDIPRRPGLPPGPRPPPTSTAVTRCWSATAARRALPGRRSSSTSTARDCVRPPVGIEGIFALYGRPRHAAFVAGIYPARVASLDLVFKDGGRTRLPAVEGGYTGRYRGTPALRARADPGGRVVRGATLLDASGREIGRTRAPRGR